MASFSNAGDRQILGRDGTVVAIAGHDDPSETGTQILAVRGQSEYGHDLGSGGDIDAAVPFGTVGFVLTQPDAAQGSIVDVDDTLERNRRWIDIETVQAGPGQALVTETPFVVHAGIHRGGQQVVRRSDSVDISGEMQVEVVHGNHLGVPATGGASLDTEGGSLGRLTDRRHRGLSERGEGLGQTDGRHRLALSRFGRCHGRDHDVPSLTAARRIGAHSIEVNLGLEATVELQVILLETDAGGDVANGLQHRRTGDLEITLHRDTAPIVPIRAGSTGTSPQASTMSLIRSMRSGMASGMTLSATPRMKASPGAAVRNTSIM